MFQRLTPYPVPVLLLMVTLGTGCPASNDEFVASPGLDASAEPDDAALQTAAADAADAADATADGPLGDAGDEREAEAPGTLDAGADPIERLITVVLAAPALAPQFVCLASFARNAQGAATGDPILAGGPFGIPDPAAAGTRKIRAGFAYGAAVRLPIFRHDRLYFDGVIPVGFLVDQVDQLTTVGNGQSETCKRAWQGSDPARRIPLDSALIGGSYVVAVTGCPDSDASGCAGADGITTSMAPLTTMVPLGPADGSAALTLQVANLSVSPALQNQDLYWQSTRTFDGGLAADGEALPLAPNALSRGQVAPRAVPIAVDGTEPALARLLVVPHGTMPCTSGEGCATIAVPIEPYRAVYAAPTGGATGAAWTGTQVLALLGGSPSRSDAVAPLRLAMFSAALAAK